MGLVALWVLVSHVLSDFAPRIQVIDVDLFIGDRYGKALAGVLLRRAVAMTITCDAYSMATINDKDANIR